MLKVNDAMLFPPDTQNMRIASFLYSRRVIIFAAYKAEAAPCSREQSRDLCAPLGCRSHASPLQPDFLFRQHKVHRTRM